MGLLNRKTAVVIPTAAGPGAVVRALKPPYQLNDLLIIILNQLSEWIPAEGYYAYTADTDDGVLSLKATRASSGIATIGPNYAGLVLGSGIRAMPLEIPALADPWAFQIDTEGLLDVGFGPKAAIRIAVDPKIRITEASKLQIQEWLRDLVPLVDLVLAAESRSQSYGTQRVLPALYRSRQDLLLQIPHLMGLLAGLGTGVVKSADGYLALWNGGEPPEYPWSLGLGLEVAERLPPVELYQAARNYRLAVWEGESLPDVVQNMGFHTLLAIPLDGSDGAAGILGLVAAEPVASSPSLIGALRFLAESLANSLHSQGASRTMARNYLQALFTASALLDEADPYNKNHHDQVASLSARLAMKAGWPEQRVRVVQTAGRLHDVGMVAVALDLTREKGNLAEKAREVIQQHPVVGSELLSGLPEPVLPSAVGRAVREHHERFDGLGYPDGLQGEELSPEGRIVACAEQFVARISHRSYRQGLSVGRALHDVERLAGHQLDPEVVSWLVRLYADAGVRPQAPA